MLIPSLHLSLIQDQQTHLFWTRIKILPILSTLKPLSNLQALNGAWTTRSQVPIYLSVGLFVWVCLCVGVFVCWFVYVDVFVCECVCVHLRKEKMRRGKSLSLLCTKKREKKRCKPEINKIINTHATVTVHIIHKFTPTYVDDFFPKLCKNSYFFYFAHLCTSWCNCSYILKLPWFNHIGQGPGPFDVAITKTRWLCWWCCDHKNHSTTLGKDQMIVPMMLAIF